VSALRLRPAGPDDADLLLGWANAPDCLAAKLRTSSPIPRAEHVEWLSRRLADPAARLRIVLDGKEAVGQIRLEPRDGALEIDIYLVPGRRGRGMARAALALAFAEPGAGPVLRARVRIANAASRRLFASLGFRETAAQADHVVLERNANGAEKP
jgi:RimJ/RimL family protein N-acetyltransferase